MSLSNPKLLDKQALGKLTEARAQKGSKIVFTNGCFDLIHPGHVSYLTEARALGDLLIVGLNSDRSVQSLKGSSRPIMDQEARAFVLAGLEAVDGVVIFDEETPLSLIERVKPDILVKGGDYKKNEVVGATEVESWGGRVVLLPFIDGHSTSSIISRIKNML